MIAQKISLKTWVVKEVPRRDITAFIETWHYSGSINGCNASFCYAMYDDNKNMVGAMFYGRMAMRNQWKRFSNVEADVIELRRLCCVDDTPKNAESYFIGATLKLLAKSWGGNIVVSYADKEFGHSGIIYQASNFEMVGAVPGAKVILWDGKQYHDRSLRCKYKGKLKPYAVKLNAAVDSGLATFKTTAGKMTYVYRLHNRKKPKHR
tara:strand:+ start:63 stop:683 length:621 start_codon:yes stop_codon:yes gene_type:complete